MRRLEELVVAVPMSYSVPSIQQRTEKVYLIGPIDMRVR